MIQSNLALSNITLFDFQGKAIWTGLKSNQFIDVSSLPSGIYLLAMGPKDSTQRIYRNLWLVSKVGKPHLGPPIAPSNKMAQWALRFRARYSLGPRLFPI